MIKLHTSHGDISLELDFEKAPVTCENFVSYVESGFYDNTIFHRVIGGFMIQGGGFTPEMQQKKSLAPIRNEADNGLKNKAYTIAMARTPDPHSATAQFFINLVDNDFLDYTSPTPEGYGYCVFGKVVDGSDIVSQIGKVKTTSRAGHRDVPVENAVIEKAEVV
ncbi:MAG: peptidyl-prolyl cis-trans isomerase [Burkholderiales bacterium]|nr:peptidyl-prolyl cis-trans isomerase [Burkholderiales bacterium]